MFGFNKSRNKVENHVESPNTELNQTTGKKSENSIEAEEQSSTRILNKFPRYLVLTFAVLVALFHIYTLGFAPLSPLIFYTVHVGLGAILILLVYPVTKTKTKTRIPWIDIILSLLVVFALTYIVINSNELVYRIGISPTTWDIIVGVIIVSIVLEVTRRTCGNILPLIAILFLLYARFGEYVPGILGHRGQSWERIFSYLKGLDGIFSTPVAASANFVFLFIIFAAFVQVSGAGKLFMDLATSLTGKTRGGPAKVAVIGSALFGTVTGNSVANVVSSGSFTIPLMKKTGYNSKFSGAVESVASTGGQIMPPVMGSAAFIMAMLVGVPYLTIMTAGIIPALLYFVSLLFIVDFEAAKKGLKGLPKGDLPKVSEVFKNLHLLIPLFVLIYMLAILQASPIRAALWAIVTTLIVSVFRKAHRLNIRKIIEALYTGTLNTLGVISACATAGIIIGVLNLTGTGLNFASMIIALAGDTLILALILTMLASIVLGMGLPTTAAYLITAAVVSPALVQLGVDVLTAHMFVFYYACLSAITPPIALAAYAGAGIANAKPMGVAVTSVRIGLIAFIVPYMFVYGPELLGMGTPTQIVIAVISSMIGIFAIASALTGWFWGKEANILLRVMLFSASLVLVYPGLLSDVIGLGLLVLSFVLRYTAFKENSVTKNTIANQKS